MLWLRKKHPRLTWKQIRRRYWGRHWTSPDGTRLYWPGQVPVTRYRYRGHRIPTPWAPPDEHPGHHPGGSKPFGTRTMIDQRSTLWSAGCVGTRTSGAEGGGEQTTARKRGMAARLRPYIEIVRYTQRNVKRWHDGDMRKRWTAAGMLVAEQQFRRVIGYRDLAKLVIAIERHALLVAEKNRDRQETRQPVTV